MPSSCLLVRDGCCHVTIPASDIDRLITCLNEEGLQHQLNILWSLFVILDQARRDEEECATPVRDHRFTDLTTCEQMNGIRQRRANEEGVEAHLP